MDARRAQAAFRFFVQWRGETRTLDFVEGEVLELGCESDDFKILGRFVSRIHARIEPRDRDFVLVDCSTNGTFVQTEDEKVTFVRRQSLRLWGEGWLSLGEPLDKATAIRFGHVE